MTEPDRKTFLEQAIADEARFRADITDPDPWTADFKARHWAYREASMNDYPFPPVPVERADTRPLRVVTRNPRARQIVLVVGLGVLAVVIAAGFLWAVVL